MTKTNKINNRKLIAKLEKLAHEVNYNRESSIKCMVQCGTLARAFDVTNDEYFDVENTKNAKNYFRNQFQTDDEIFERLENYVSYYQYKKDLDDLIAIKYIIEIVDFFNRPLAEKMRVYRDENIDINDLY